MRAAQVGEIVRIHYDAPTDVAEGDAIVTATTGRVYLVVDARRQAAGKHAGRWHLHCLVAAFVPPGVRIHQLSWYPRRRTSRNR